MTSGSINTYMYAIYNYNSGTRTDIPAISISGSTSINTTRVAIYNGNGLLSISGGTIRTTYDSNNSDSTPINNQINGNVEVTGGEIIATGGYGLYNSNNSAIINISGGTVTGKNYGIRQVSTDANITITGGTISATNGTGVSTSIGTITLGTDDGTVTSSSTAKPEITGTTNGIQITGAGTFNFYDGVVKGATGQSISASTVNTPTGYNVVKTTSGSVETAMLEQDVFLKAVSGTQSSTSAFLGTSIKRNQIAKVSFTTSIEGHTVDNTTCWDVGTIQGKVLMWIDGGDATNGYEIVIGQNGGVRANANSQYLFSYIGKSITAEINLANLDTSNVTNMLGMFSDCRKVTTLDVSNFNTSAVTNMNGMFSGCSKVTTLDVSGFDTSKVTNMCLMFSECSKVTTLDVSRFDTSKVTNIGYMFNGCNVTTLDVSGFDTSKVTDMGGMFRGCSSLTSLDVSSFNTAAVTEMNEMFSECRKVTTLDVSGFDTSKVTSMGYMFSGCRSLTSLDVSSFNTAAVTNMGSMFSYCSRVTALDVSGFDTSKVTNMGYMYSGCSSLTSLDVSSFNTAAVTNMVDMFSVCSSLTSLDVSSFNTAAVTNMTYMFKGCSSLTSLDVSSFNTAAVTNMTYMFSGCSSLTSLDVSSFNTAAVMNMTYMFSGCSSLTSLDVSSFNTAAVTNMTYMFRDCSSLTTIYASNDFVTTKGGTMMFHQDTNLVGGAGTVYDSSHTDHTYAHIDGGTSNPGYFTQGPAPNSDVTFPTDYGTIDVIWLSGTTNTVASTPNAPVLTKNGESMTKVTWTYNSSTSTWSEDATPKSTWYSYNAISTRQASGRTTENLTSMWANAKTANGAYFVWIPRYAYRITYYESETSTTPTGYYDGNGMWRASDGLKKYALDSGVETVTYNGNCYIVHPAFETNLDLGGWSSDLSGFWFAKYEMSGNSISALTSVPNVASKSSDKDIGTHYLWGRQAKYGYNGTSETLSSNGTNYTYTSYMSSHMMKNSEWGAVAYLTHSQYGRNGNEIDINNSSSYITGNGGGSTSARSATGTTNAYNTAVGAKASTTGNIYGIYDMSGGAYDRPAAYDKLGSATYIEGSSYGLNMTQEAKDSSGNYESTKYITAYSNGTTSYSGNTIVYGVGKTGDATKEVNKGGNYTATSTYYGNWNADYSYFCNANSAFFIRGERNNMQDGAGVFCSTGNNGGNYRDSYNIAYSSFRAVLCP